MERFGILLEFRFSLHGMNIEIFKTYILIHGPMNIEPNLILIEILSEEGADTRDNHSCKFVTNSQENIIGLKSY